MTKTVTQDYLEGMEYAEDHIYNLRETIKGFAASSPVGQMLRGELQFWLNQVKRTK